MPNDLVPTPAPAPADPAQAFQNALNKKNGDGIALASQLFDENFTYRQKIRDLETRLPKDGNVVLSVDDAKEWEAFKQLNVKAVDAKKAIESVTTLEKANKELASMESLRELADIGIDGSKLKLSVLKDQLSAKYPDAKITFKTEKDKDGNEAKVAYFQKTDKDAVTKFSEFANAELADYLPALKVSAEANQPVPPGNTGDPSPTGGGSNVFERIRGDVKKQGEGNKPVDIDARFGRAPMTAAA